MIASIRRRVERVFAQYERRFWVLVAVQFVVAIGFGAAMPFVSIYLHNELGMPMTWVGGMMLVSALISAVGRTAGGEISDRVGRRPILVGGMAIRVAAFAAMAYVIYRGAGPWIVAAVYLTVRLVGAIVRPALAAMVADVVPSSRRVDAYAVFRIGQNAGWAIGPAIGGFLVSTSYASLFLLTTVASFIGLMLVTFLTNESHTQRGVAQRASLRAVFDVARDTRFVAFCAWSVLLFLVMGQFASTLAVFATDAVGIAEAQLGILFTVNGVAVVLFQWPAARLARRIGIRWGLVLGCLLYAAGYLSVGFAGGFAFLILSMVVITLGEVSFSPTSMAAVANMSTEGNVGRYMGFFGLTEALGWSMGPFIGGLLYDRLASSPLVLWGIISLLGVGAAIGFSSLRIPQADPRVDET